MSHHATTNGRQPPATEDNALQDIFTPVKLPCGRTLSNRLVKAAMYEHMALLLGGPPNRNHLDLYAQWSKGDWGMIMTSNVQVKRDHLTLGRDIVLPEELTPETCRPFVKLAKAIHGRGLHSKRDGVPLAIMQLSHAGRQSTNVIGGRGLGPPLAPSAVPLHLKDRQDAGHSRFSSMLSGALFQTPQEMTRADIDMVLDAFVRGARLAAQAGFDGIELHAAHGYLLAQFISPKSNIRTDEYGSATDALCFLRRITSSIRAPGVVPKDFIVGVKLNAADYVEDAHDQPEGSSDEDRVLRHIREIASWRMFDFIEISGGNYEDPDFMNADGPREPVRPRQALFSKFAQRAASEIAQLDLGSRRPLVLLTGGLLTSELMTSALSHGHADLLGIGRLSVTCPQLPKLLKTVKSFDASNDDNIDFDDGFDISKGDTIATSIEKTVSNLLVNLYLVTPKIIRPQFPKLIGVGVEMSSYAVLMQELAQGIRPASMSCSAKILEFGNVIRIWLYRAPGLDVATPQSRFPPRCMHTYKPHYKDLRGDFWST